jgi:hypothetical protein
MLSDATVFPALCDFASSSDLGTFNGDLMGLRIFN